MPRGLIGIVGNIVVGEDLIEPTFPVPVVFISVPALEALVVMLEGN